MKSSVITVTKKKHPNDDCSPLLTNEYSSFKSKNIDRQDENKINIANDYFDQAISITDPKFLAPVRRWEKKMGFVTPIRWINTISITLLHIAFLSSLYLVYIRGGSYFSTFIFGYVYGGIGGFGVTAGAHRYWTHRSYKAKLPMQILLMLAYSAAGQNTIPEWVRDHRVHHKMSESNADPHDANRGFFFAHVGWLMMRKHPNVIKEGNKLDMSDVLNDPLVQFHTKHFIVLKILCCFVIPLFIPVLWGETWEMCFAALVIRYTLNLHFTWSVNSFAHLWGNKPYDIKIMPVENWIVSIMAMGEGWHNYHHTFPWDYKAAELAYFINITTFFIDCFGLLGWAYDLKRAHPLLIDVIKEKKGPKLEHVN